MSEQAKPKERFALRLEPKLLEELDAEAEAKQVSVTSIIEQALRDRKTAREIAEDAIDEHFIKASGLCAECAARYKLETANTSYDYVYRPRKLVRDMLWKWWGNWSHGRYDGGCPGWEDVAPADIVAASKKALNQAAEDILNSDATFRRVV
jgi:hypothetical protein